MSECRRSKAGLHKLNDKAKQGLRHVIIVWITDYTEYGVMAGYRRGRVGLHTDVANPVSILVWQKRD